MDVAAGCNITDVIISSPIVMGEDMGGGAAAAGGADGQPADPLAALGIDPSMDPELAEAIRISLQEAQAANPPPAEPEPAQSAPLEPVPVAQPGA